MQQNADDFTGIEPGSCDAVIINSVVQYFPGVDYLIRVLRGAIEAVAPGGFIFIGDVRSLPLLKALHASVELRKAEAALPVAQLRRRVEKRVDQEEELVIDPAFFTALANYLPQISHVEIQPKRGRYRNELTQFRYQVTIHVGEHKSPATEDLSWVDWRENRWDLAELRRRLAQHETERLAITDVANARLVGPVSIAQTLNEANGSQTAGELREMLGAEEGQGFDPEELYR